MKEFTISLCLLLNIAVRSQTFNGGSGPIQNNGVETYFSLNVTGLNPANMDSIFGLEEVCINISHPKVEELYIYLISPSGTTVELTEGASCSGQNYDSTRFNSSASLPITSFSAPYTGIMRPIGYLGRFNTGQIGNGNWQLVVKDYMPFINSGNLLSWSLKFGNAPSKPVILTTSNLPIVIINTNNQVITELKETVDFGIIYNGIGQLNHVWDPKNNYNAKATVHIRGNTTKNFEKKAYAVELHDANGMKVLAPILGMPAESDWELIAQYQDKTLMRIPLTYQLSRQMGNYAARTRNVELIINGEYMGVYALVEKIKRGVDRLNIRKLGTNDNAMPYISGGYLLKIDRTTVPGFYSFLPGYCQNGAHFYYQYDDPKDTVITPQQNTYIKNYLNTFENLMSAANYSDNSNGYRNYVDMASCIDVLIINEISRNVDGYRLSSYLYKDDVSQGGKLHMGPVWDYDIAWHNANYSDAFDPIGWEYLSQDTVHPAPVWWTKFMQDSVFVNALYCRWFSLRSNVLSNNNIYHFIDSTAAAISEAQTRNFKQWPILGTYIMPNPQNQVGASYATEVADLKNWVSNRFTWLDGAIQGKCTNIGIKNNVLENDILTVYPNPTKNAVIFKMNLAQKSNVKLTITDGIGRTIMSRANQQMNPGNSEINIGKDEIWGKGIYFYQLQIEDVKHSGKIIVE